MHAFKKISLRTVIPYAACVIGLVIVALLIPNFAKPGNLLNIVKQSSFIAIPAVGLSVVMITGGIDLSIGGIMSFAGIVNGSLLLAGVPLGLAMPIAILLSTLIGAANGSVIGKIGVPAFICSYTFGEIATGIALLLSNGDTIGPFQSEVFKFLGNGEIFSIPMVDILLIVYAILGTVILSKLPIGNRIYAIGNNALVVSQEGISVSNLKIFAYAFGAFCAAMGGLLLSARMSTSAPMAGASYQLDCVAACIIGGIGLSGGTGKVLNSVLGALIIGALKNGLNLLRVHPFVQNVVLGSLIVVVVIISIYVKDRELKELSAY